MNIIRFLAARARRLVARLAGFDSSLRIRCDQDVYGGDLIRRCHTGGFLLVPVSVELVDRCSEWSAPAMLETRFVPRPGDPYVVDLEFRRPDTAARDAAHLEWVHARLVLDGENPTLDFMRRLRQIADRLNGGPVTFADVVLNESGDTRGEQGTHDVREWEVGW